MKTATDARYMELLREASEGRVGWLHPIQYAAGLGVSIPALLELLATRNAERDGPNRAVVCCDPNCETLCYRLIDIKSGRMN
jgi:hypothetical protein